MWSNKSVHRVGNGGRVEDNDAAGSGSHLRGVPYQRLRRLQLKQQQIAFAHVAQAGIDVVEGELPVRPGRHDDRVFSVAIYRDERPPCQHTRDQAYMSRVDVLFGERTLNQLAVRVVADGSDDCRCRARPCRRDRLVRALCLPPRRRCRNPARSRRAPASGPRVLGGRRSDCRRRIPERGDGRCSQRRPVRSVDEPCWEYH